MLWWSQGRVNTLLEGYLGGLFINSPMIKTGLDLYNDNVLRTVGGEYHGEGFKKWINDRRPLLTRGHYEAIFEMIRLGNAQHEPYLDLFQSISMQYLSSNDIKQVRMGFVIFQKPNLVYYEGNDRYIDPDTLNMYTVDDLNTPIGCMKYHPNISPGTTKERELYEKLVGKNEDVNDNVGGRDDCTIEYVVVKTRGKTPENIKYELGEPCEERVLLDFGDVEHLIDHKEGVHRYNNAQNKWLKDTAHVQKTPYQNIIKWDNFKLERDEKLKEGTRVIKYDKNHKRWLFVSADTGVYDTNHVYLSLQKDVAYAWVHGGIWKRIGVLVRGGVVKYDKHSYIASRYDKYIDNLTQD